MKQNIQMNLAAFALATLLVLFLASPLVQAQSYNQTDAPDMSADPTAASGNEDLIDYDAIVNELSHAKPASTTRARAKSLDNSKSFSDSMIHLGVGYADMIQTLATPTTTTNVNQRGVQVSLGIDLFSPSLMAEGTMRSFGSESYHDTSVALKEFDLKFYYKNIIAPKVQFKIGGGLSARYLTIQEHSNGQTDDYSTPSSVASIGLDFFASDSISVGTEFALRTAMVSDTIDKQSFDGLIRVDTHF